MAPAPPRLEVSASRDSLTQSISVVGEIDLVTMPQLEAALEQMELGSRLVVDLRECDFIDVGGVASLIAEQARRGSEFRVAVRRGTEVASVLALVAGRGALLLVTEEAGGGA